MLQCSCINSFGIKKCFPTVFFVSQRQHAATKFKFVHKCTTDDHCLWIKKLPECGCPRVSPLKVTQGHRNLYGSILDLTDDFSLVIHIRWWKSWHVYSFGHNSTTWRTDGQTDGRTDGLVETEHQYRAVYRLMRDKTRRHSEFERISKIYNDICSISPPSLLPSDLRGRWKEQKIMWTSLRQNFLSV